MIFLKSVLTSLPVYALSFFKASSGIISSIESIFNKNFWGGSEDNRKISYITWSTVSSRKKYGGLGVRQYMVLAARYGEEAGRLEVGGRSVSSWWREIAKIRDGVGEADGGWFTDRVSRGVGDGVNIFFLYDRWLGEVPLCKRFTCLFDSATNKLSTVAEMHILCWEEGGEAWRWRRRLWVWEEDMLAECRNFIIGFVLQCHIPDRW